MTNGLPIRIVEKPWGRDRLPPPFADAAGGRRIGEIWFEPPPELPQILVKYIFTSERLSIQVHPNDQQAGAAAGAAAASGKDECWLLIDAEPGASLGLGFRRPISREEVRAAALDGSIERLLDWHPVAPGDFIYVPANTVHAIGGGVSLIEVQQNADATYRLYDYGRPRDLHLEQGTAVARGEPHDPALRCKVPERGTIPLVEGPHFVLHRLDGAPDPALLTAYDAPMLVVPLQGEVRRRGIALQPGDCGFAASLGELEFSGAGQCLIVRPSDGVRRPR